MRRTQTFSVTDPIAFSFCLHVGNAGTGYHTDSLCGCLPDTVKKELSICEVCRNSSMTFEIGQGIFVSEQGQKFHLTRYCRTFKNLRVTEYLKCTACVHLEILCEIQYFVSEELLLRLQIRQGICLRLLQKPLSFCLKWDGTPCTFLECIWTALRPGQRFPFWPLIERGCENLHQWTLWDQLHAYYFVFGCVDGRQACERAHHVA